MGQTTMVMDGFGSNQNKETTLSNYESSKLFKRGSARSYNDNFEYNQQYTERRMK